MIDAQKSPKNAGTRQQGKEKVWDELKKSRPPYGGTRLPLTRKSKNYNQARCLTTDGTKKLQQC